MTTILIHHDINKDLKHWLSSEARKQSLEPIGVTNIRTFVDPKDPTHVAFIADVADMDALNAMMQSKVASEGMAHDGVVLDSMVFLVEAGTA